MKARFGNSGGKIGRRDLLRGAAAAGIALALPGAACFASRSQQSGNRGGSGHLWFEHAEIPDVYVPYQYESEADGTLWLEDDDGYMHAFSAGEFQLVQEPDGLRLWLHDTEADWHGYHCLSEKEAAELLEQVA